MKLISNQINPHFTLRDALYGVAQLRFIGSKKQINFLEWFGTRNYKLFNVGRSALTTIIDVVQPAKDKRIAIPAFVCGVVALPFISAGYKIEWIDTDDNGCIDLEDFRRKSDNVSMLVVPHIFGQMIDLVPFADICRAKQIFLIEDCAHGWSGDLIADARILSFGREKVVSCVAGGALVWPNNSKYAAVFQNISLQQPARTWVLKHALQPLWYSLSMAWWNMGGKIIPILAQKLKFLPKAVYKAEKNGKNVLSVFALSYVQQRILAYQLKRFFGNKKKNKKSVLKHQKNIAEYWKDSLAGIFSPEEIIISASGFRVIVKTPKAKKIRSVLLKQNIHLREWDGEPIAPAGTDLSAFGYRKGDCPGAEFFGHNYITLPINRHISKKDVKKIAQILKHCIK
jgi:dTDP-4-amino-4,6-dideoxygalactose transaminase